jgi:lipoyl(octanoyl) transferase
MNKTIQLQDLGNKDYKETWDQEELFKGIVDLKIRNRREELTLATPNYLCLWNILMFIPREKRRFV